MAGHRDGAFRLARLMVRIPSLHSGLMKVISMPSVRMSEKLTFMYLEAFYGTAVGGWVNGLDGGIKCTY